MSRRPPASMKRNGSGIERTRRVVLDQIRVVDRIRLVKRLGALTEATLLKSLDVLQEMFAA